MISKHLKRLKAAQAFLNKARTKSLSSGEYTQLMHCVRLLKKKATLRPKKPDNIVALAAIFKDFDAFNKKRTK